MASRTTNTAVSALRARHRAEDEARVVRRRTEEAAVVLVARSGAAVAAVRRKRAEVMARLDAEVTEAQGRYAVGLAVLVALLGGDEAAAAVAGVDVATVRAARKVAAPARVREQITALGETRR